jgi:hypothetical protein
MTWGTRTCVCHLSLMLQISQVDVELHCNRRKSWAAVSISTWTLVRHPSSLQDSSDADNLLPSVLLQLRCLCRFAAESRQACRQWRRGRVSTLFSISPPPQRYSISCSASDLACSPIQSLIIWDPSFHPVFLGAIVQMSGMSYSLRSIYIIASEHGQVGHLTPPPP